MGEGTRGFPSPNYFDPMRPGEFFRRRNHDRPFTDDQILRKTGEFDLNVFLDPLLTFARLLIVDNILCTQEAIDTFAQILRFNGFSAFDMRRHIFEVIGKSSYFPFAIDIGMMKLYGMKVSVESLLSSLRPVE